MKVAWLHNFSRKTSGSWMYTIYDDFIRNKTDVRIDLIDIGSVNNPLVFLIKLARFSRLLKGYDIIHAQYGSGTGFFASLIPRKKIVSLRGSDWYYYPSLNLSERFHSWLACRLTKIRLSSYDVVVVMSERMKTEVSCFNKELNVKVIPDGINLDVLLPAEAKKNNRFRVVFSSVLQDNRLKRFDLAKAAFEIFSKNHPDSELVFMNGVPQNQVGDIISSGNVILLTSVHEGWPNIIKEGLACSVPFVSTDVSDLKCIAERTDSCFVCNDDPESLAAGLEKVYTNEHKEDLRKFALQFDVKVNTEKLTELYKQVYEG